MSDAVVARDLHLDYDEAQLDAFYRDFMVPNFGAFEDELEDVGVWKQLLDPARRTPEDERLNLHVVLLLDPEDRKTIHAGVAFEYYPRSNCGLLTYIAVDPNRRGGGLGRRLVAEVIRALNAVAAKAGEGRCGAIFLETNSEKVPPERDVMVPAVRQKVLSNLGFRVLNFTYVQPALSEDRGKSHDLLLACHESFLQDTGSSGVKGIPGALVYDWLREFYGVLGGKEDVDDDPDLTMSRNELRASAMVSARGA